ncbi:ankyrin repeat domain-containing protein [Brevibacillus antibioticus]|uniref:Ankyrin repeat domain-containing protein n=1 Tax=Brevibacillus antibioticus TaxID=2570228 RepID=A0A4U2Y9K7_9BACL|nr:ankyrin repeat domain-containing protein [Brevibacillus antibioticus]TKI56915.1 ankyrin repeat domain-containing protein [Brevibacillus antibioticus]
MHEYFRDLTYYSFHHFENAQNIGWISGDNDYITGTVTNEFIENLSLYTMKTFNDIRGNMKCSLCNENKLISTETASIGLSEIRVLSEKGENKYASTNMIIHYVIEHNYCPPEEFIQAVIDGPKPGSNAYQEYVKRYNVECLWGESDDTILTSEKLRNGILNNDRKLIRDYSDCCNIITRDGSLLNVAIKSRNVELVNELIQYGADINKFNGIELNNAVVESENEIIRLLLSQKITIDVSTPKLNPLFTAIRKGNYEASKLLLENGIDANIKYTNEFMKNMDAITLAKHCKQESIIELLEKY